MKGNWLYVWKIKSVGRWETLLALLEQYKPGIDGIMLKLAEGTMPYNRVNADMKTVTNDAYLKEWIDGMRSGGYQVEGWHYVYPDQTSLQGDVADERRQKLGLNKWLINAETEWKNISGANKKAEVYLGKLHQGRFEIGFTSYRYPDLHANFPFGAWLNEQEIGFNAPQVYWIGSHNPILQTEKSREQYFNNGWTQQFFPSASAFGSGSWEPTIQDLTEMRSYCLSRFGGVIWWSLDWMVKNKRWDWLYAISGGGAIPPAVEEVQPIKFVKVNTTELNMRSGPGKNYRDIGTTLRGCELPVVEERGDWYRVEGWVYKPYTV